MTIDYTSLIIGLIIGASTMFIIYGVIKLFKPKPMGLPLLRQKIEVGHEALKQANQVFSEIYSAFNDAEDILR